MDKCREAFEAWAKDQDLDITIVDFTGSVKLIDRDGNQRQFCYEEFETDTAWSVWQSRQAEVDQQKLLTLDSDLHLDAAKEEIERLKAQLGIKRDQIKGFESEIKKAWQAVDEKDKRITELEKSEFALAKVKQILNKHIKTRLLESIIVRELIDLLFSNKG